MLSAAHYHYRYTVTARHTRTCRQTQQQRHHRCLCESMFPAIIKFVSFVSDFRSLASLSMTVLIIPVGLRMFNLSHLPMTVPGPDVSNERCLYTRIVFIIIGMLIYQRLTKVPKVIVAAPLI